MKNTLLKFAALTFALLLCSHGYAQKKTFIRDYLYQASENDSKNTARAAAVQQMQILLLQEIGQALQSEQTLRKLSVTKSGMETFSESFSQEVMAITAGFVEMKILHEAWNGKTYYVEAQMTVDPKEVSQRIAKVLDDKHTANPIQAPVQPKPAVKEKPKPIEDEKVVRDWYQPKALGLDFGLMVLPLEQDYLYSNIGIRFTRNISPNVGLDIFKLNLGIHGRGFWYYYDRSKHDRGDWHYYRNEDSERMSLTTSFIQLLTGIRFASNRFGKNKNMYFYSSLRAGVGWVYYVYNYEYLNQHYEYTLNSYNSFNPFYRHTYNDNSFAIATELDAGIYFKRFFLGATMNHNFFNSPSYIYSPELGDVRKTMRTPAWGLRFGCDFGKPKPY